MTLRTKLSIILKNNLFFFLFKKQDFFYLINFPESLKNSFLLVFCLLDGFNKTPEISPQRVSLIFVLKIFWIFFRNFFKISFFLLGKNVWFFLFRFLNFHPIFFSLQRSRLSLDIEVYHLSEFKFVFIQY